MKKMMLLAGLLVLGTIGYAEVNGSNEAEFKARVMILPQINVQATNIDFGNVAIGSKNNTEKAPGTVTITGKENEKVLVSFYTQNDEEWHGTLNFGTESGIDGTAKVDNSNTFKNISKTLTNGEAKLTVTGVVNVGDQVTEGEHFSEPITVKVIYDGGLEG